MAIKEENVNPPGKTIAQGDIALNISPLSKRIEKAIKGSAGLPFFDLGAIRENEFEVWDRFFNLQTLFPCSRWKDDANEFTVVQPIFIGCALDLASMPLEKVRIHVRGTRAEERYASN